MNRSQTRKFRSLAKKKGVSHSLAEMYISMRNRGSAPQDLHDGDLVRLNVEQIMKHPDYPMRRKTPCFSYGDIRRVHRIYASN